MLDRLRALRLIFCTGQGAWEERMIRETHQLEDVLRDKSIPAWVDYLGQRRLARLAVVASPDRLFHGSLARQTTSSAASPEAFAKRAESPRL